MKPHLTFLSSKDNTLLNILVFQLPKLMLHFRNVVIMDM